MAIKLLDDSHALHEYEILRSLKHPNLASAFAYFREKGNSCIVMSYHKGCTLTQAVLKKGSFSEELAKEHFRGLLRAVDYLHQHRIMHSDVKTDNIMCQPGLTLVDFGSACWLDMEPRPSSYTYDFTAPEVLDGEPPSEKHDVWGCGVCLYFMLRGQLAKKISFKGLSVDCSTVLADALHLDKTLRCAPMILLQRPWLHDASLDEKGRSKSSRSGARNAPKRGRFR